MNGQTLVDLLISFMDDEIISEQLAYQLLNMAKDIIEMERPWMKLRTFKDDYLFLSSDGYSDFQDLPTNFLMTYGDSPLKLINGSEVLKFREIPLEDRDENRDVIGLFYIDHNAEKLAIVGGLSKGYSGTLYYVGRSPVITETSTWIFPAMAHPLLVIQALIIHRGEIDFDTINARMVQYGFSTASAMKQTLAIWDGQLQAKSRRGRTKGSIF